MKHISWLMRTVLTIGFVVTYPIHWYWGKLKKHLRDAKEGSASLPGLGLEVSVFGVFGLLMIGNLALAIGG